MVMFPIFFRRHHLMIIVNLLYQICRNIINTKPFQMKSFFLSMRRCLKNGLSPSICTLVRYLTAYVNSYIKYGTLVNNLYINVYIFWFIHAYNHTFNLVKFAVNGFIYIVFYAVNISLFSVKLCIASDYVIP